MKSTEIKELEAVHADAQTNLDQLKADREAWPQKYQAALDSGDTEKVLALQSERDRLEKFGTVVKANVLRAGIALREARAVVAATEREAAFVALQKAETKLQAAQQSYNEAQSLAGAADSALRDLQTDNAAAQREFERIMAAQLAPAAPVVRSIPHQINSHFSAL